MCSQPQAGCPQLHELLIMCWDICLDHTSTVSKSVNGFPFGLCIHQSDGILKPIGYLTKKLPCIPIFSPGKGGREERG